MAFGIGRLRLAPDLFWSLTPAELLLMAEAGRPTASALDRAALDGLIARHDRPVP
ncbi:MAG: phage tail assembly chaperone [Beijerinckiaceae bacterium]|nr:phage tail assembly chaperone [Beijerinckiaceae bacterium]